MWKHLVSTLENNSRFESPARKLDIDNAEKLLNVSFPRQLQECLQEANGIYGEYDLGLVWPLDKIVHTNLQFRQSPNYKQLYMPFDSLLFFADAGNGDQFAFPIQAEQIRRDDVFVWNHEDDSRFWVAPDLEKYIEWQLTGKIST
ncbi:SMI1/KNR4 family protein [Vibrio parahaemolyticus]|uniref:SMI1/KNR4 family protein n=1 Tax=Vibrio rotiferianus TaxID=190895 RepID=A0A7Y4E498_9VIBR|nr:SMI1/KNR4 family protein [Vibrio rotiferianus]EGR1584616.1 SMI1/KNR4 family protein [Vibrio parahaemolyticus]ELA8363832.1 SMI1/KNR4 family protein [Vibrio alginolyticus]EHZ7317664.1 SMI1/KNR4 family protein [Vibrio parahaemolyticus]EIA4668587.1 SMI1/KNR4 family protein [Vibrio parahaemolyticus]EIC2729052.1 SMI1/KNR4 family protein [Vibrio parahaemolyticus]